MSVASSPTMLHESTTGQLLHVGGNHTTLFAEREILGYFLPLTRSMHQVYEPLCSRMPSVLHTVDSMVYHIAYIWESKHLVHFAGKSTTFIAWALGDDSGHLWAGVYIPEAALGLGLEVGIPAVLSGFQTTFLCPRRSGCKPQDCHALSSWGCS